MHDTADPLFVSTFASASASASASGAGGPRSIVCVHGIESHGLRYLALAARLGAECRVVAPDLRGHGRSPKVGPWTVARHVEDLLPIVTALESPVLLGHSYGGLLAWEVARALPGGIAALVLVDPAINVSAEVARVSQLNEYTSVGHTWPDEAAAFADFAAGRTPDGASSAAMDAAVAVVRRAADRRAAESAIRPRSRQLFDLERGSLTERTPYPRRPSRPGGIHGRLV